ncbi:MAG: hypothetical protein HYZ11_08320 [Candidatus Tectomicrobia bacterium]|uniref:Uncharacterized protein n=1 Tax=Tectimicrobiota bacterium TaxID=2528274 RepID=A0A932I0L8_UNCTE|nr:hypothetical protein [Candidatus Tectomicrobia bacterium]
MESPSEIEAKSHFDRLYFEVLARREMADELRRSAEETYLAAVNEESEAEQFRIVAQMLGPVMVLAGLSSSDPTANHRLQMDIRGRLAERKGTLSEQEVNALAAVASEAQRVAKMLSAA